MSQLYDLIEFRWDSTLRTFVKQATILPNVPKSIAYAKKKSMIFHNQITRTTRFKVVKNGEYQYKTRFK